MTTKATQTRTVRFYEVVDHKSALPLPHLLPWDKSLEHLADGSLKPLDRTVKIAGEDHHGGAWMGTPNMLLLSKIREDYDVPEVFDRANGTLEALQLAESQGVAETSHISFFEGNIVGMIRSTASPGATSLSNWLNGMKLFDGVDKLDVIPLSRVSVQAKVADIERVNGVKIRARSTAAQALADNGAPRLAETIDRLTDQFGPITVEMRVYVTRDQPAVDVRGTIMEEATGLIALTQDGHAVAGLEAASLSYQSRERERTEELNMLNDKFAERVEIEVVDSQGKVTRRESAAKAMQLAFNHLRDDLIRAIDRPRA
jgi:hypothetical protein